MIWALNSILSWYFCKMFAVPYKRFEAPTTTVAFSVAMGSPLCILNISKVGTWFPVVLNMYFTSPTALHRIRHFMSSSAIWPILHNILVRILQSSLSFGVHVAFRPSPCFAI